MMNIPSNVFPIIETQDFEVIENASPPNEKTLYCIDIDNTIKMNKPCALMTKEGRDFFSYNYFSDATFEKGQLAKRIYSSWSYFYEECYGQLVQEGIPDCIDRLEQRGIVVGVTSRMMEIRGLTEDLLRKFKIFFSEVADEELVPQLEDVFIQNGTIYTNHYGKANAINVVYKHLDKRFDPILNIVVIDDQLGFLNEIGTKLYSILKELGVKLHLYHYTRVEKLNNVRDLDTLKIMKCQCDYLSRGRLLTDQDVLEHVFKNGDQKRIKIWVLTSVILGLALMTLFLRTNK